MEVGENSQKDLEMKLGRLVDVDRENLVASVNEQIRVHKVIKSVSSKAAAAGSSTISPVRGNGASPLHKPTKGNIVPYKDAFCLQLNGNDGYCETSQQCDYEIEYADHSSSIGVLARDEVHLKIANGSSTKLDAVFG
ncbi:hypothetical protein HS088_TW20G00724 [Tripterygium wilfordii]|uniref:Xylanase inhibitor N-terminal domain-containing protein n=1 Tax=Tripterygium wilfordii TaxID=458696 RepID=A0A7J7C885_TRIWF|nr:hypothetical protein HS088_TW20G00724 [Tripterygium wilfordii]